MPESEAQKLLRVKQNIKKMLDQGAVPGEIGAYVESEGFTPEDLQAAPSIPELQNVVPTEPEYPELTKEEFNKQLREQGPGPMSMWMYRFLLDDPRFVDKYLGGRPNFEATGAGIGGIGGAIAGGAAGSILPGAGTTTGAAGGGIAGSMMGAAGGTSLYDALAGFEDRRDFPNAPAQGNLEALGNTASNMVDAATLEGAWGLGFHGARPVVSGLTKGLGRVTGLRKKMPVPGGGSTVDTVPWVKEDMTKAELKGIPYGAMNTGKKAFETSAKVLGVMPLIGGPIRATLNDQYSALSKNFVKFLDDVSPLHKLTDLGRNMTEAAKKTVKAQRNVIAAYYGDMFRYFDEIGNPAVIPTSGIKAAANRGLEQFNQLPKETKTTIKESGILGPDGRPVTFPVTETGDPISANFAHGDPFIDTLKRFNNLPEHITPREYRALMRDLNRAIRGRANNRELAHEFSVLEGMQQAGQRSLTQIDANRLSPEVASTIKDKVERANSAYSSFMDMISRPAANRFGRIDRNIFKHGFMKPGTVNVDELATTLLGESSTFRSPQFIDDLETLIGPENRLALGRAVLVKAAKPEQVKNLADEEMFVFNPTRMREMLGIHPADADLGDVYIKNNRDTLNRLLQGTGINADMLDEFLDIAEKVQASQITDPSTFLTRKVVFSGKPSFFPKKSRVGAQAAGILASLVSLGTFTIAGRQFSKLISTPGGLKLMTEGLQLKPTKANMLMMLPRFEKVLGSDADVTLSELSSSQQDNFTIPLFGITIREPGEAFKPQEEDE